MKSTKNKWIFTLILAAVEIFLTAADLGYFTIGRIAFTILHIPVFLATTLIGLPQGVFIAGIFGCSSLISAYLHPTGALDYLFQNPMLSVVPRLMIPFAVWLVYKLVCRVADDHTMSGKLICTGFASISGVIANAVFVVLFFVLLVPEAIGITDNLTASSIIITNIIAVNVGYEIIISVCVTVLAVLFLNDRKLLKDPVSAEKDSGNAEGAAEGKEQEEGIYRDKPIQKTFRKWLFLFMSLSFIMMLFFLYHLFTQQDRQHARELLTEKSEDIIHLIGVSEDAAEQDNLTIGQSGFVILARDNVIVASGLKTMEVRLISDMYPDYDKTEPGVMSEMIVDGISGAGIIRQSNDLTVLSFLPDSEIFEGRNMTLSYLLGGLLAIYVLLFEMISVLVQRNVTQKIQDVNTCLGQIRAGNLDRKVTVTGNNEFEELSLGINTTVDALKETMQEIANKNHQELEFAREVQISSLPSGRLAKQGKCGFVVLGSMQAAREVGGDFYDYFMIGEDKLGVVIADVSGKGIPSALFMMTAKTLVRNFVLGGKSPAEALQLANVQLCENNESGMFVTVWLGVLDLSTGTMEFANAAHNPPLLKKKEEPFLFMDYKKFRRGLVLAAMEDTVYKNNVITLGKGDMLFLYTDGVTEAANTDLKLYGEQRLLKCMEANYNLPPKELLYAVHEDIDAFVAGMEQYDDMTMVVLKME